MTLTKELNDEIWDFCRVNNITGVDDFILKLVKQGFTIEKYGATPVTNVVEKTIEVPVERIVEKLVEVPVQMVDTEMSQQLKDKTLESERLTKELTAALIDIKNKQEELVKLKNKKDIYGE